MCSKRIVWTKARSSDWLEWRRGEWRALLATLLVSAYIPASPLVIGVTIVCNEYYKNVTRHVNAIACPSCDSWRSLGTCPPVPCLV